MVFSHLLKAKSKYIAFFTENMLFTRNFNFKKILDIGCGRRGWLSLLLKQHYNVQIYTTDIVEDKVHTARNIARELNCESEGYVVADSTHLPFKPYAFDLIMGNAILHHLLPNIRQAAQEIFTCLTHRGEAIFTGEIVASQPICHIMQGYYKISNSDEGVTTKHHWLTTFKNAKFTNITVARENRANYTDNKLKKIIYTVMKYLPSIICIHFLVTSCTIIAKK